MSTYPIIVIGMHRSGTTMLARQLEALGVFMGKQKEENQEAVLFFQIDTWLASQCGGSWDNPQAIRYLLGNQEVRTQVTEYIRDYLLTTARAASYLGWQNYIRYRSPFKLVQPWGWKSPLSTFTLPIWLDLFPDAKVIHISRHGVDVANSLKQRERRAVSLTLFQRLYYKMRILHAIRPKSGEFIRPRCDLLQGGLSLWEEYVSQAHSHVCSLGERALELKYEDLLTQPNVVLRKLTEFCGLRRSDEEIEKAASLVRRDRAYAYREKPDLIAFADGVPERLSVYGY